MQTSPIPKLHLVMDAVSVQVRCHRDNSTICGYEFKSFDDLSGQYLARDSIWIAIVSVLATCNITKAVGEYGKEIEPTDDCVSGIVA